MHDRSQEMEAACARSHKGGIGQELNPFGIFYIEDSLPKGGEFRGLSGWLLVQKVNDPL